MRSISLLEEDPNIGMFNDAANALRAGGLIAFPCGSTYRIAADVNSADAVMKLLQSKRRTRRAPGLVFVSSTAMLSGITGELDPVIQRLTKQIWPGDLTVLVEPKLDLPTKVIKQLLKSNNKIGVRIPVDETAKGIVDAFDGPLLISSANIEKKKGAYSLAQVRKNFHRTLDMFFFAGDLPPAPSSTVVDVRDGEISIIRAGGLSEEEIRQAAAP